MGLDMYLHKKSYYGGRWRGKDGHKGEHTLALSGSFAEDNRIDISRVSYIEESVGYWRKANQIHHWFIENCASGDGDKREMYVEKEQLEDLLNVCLKVREASNLIDGIIKNGQKYTKHGWVDITETGKYIEDSSVAEKLLPVQEGFFFGSLEYDQYYYKDLVNTIEIIQNVLKECAEMHKSGTYAEFYYHASW